MPLPETIRVKLSSESAEAISITPVVVQEMPLRELVEHMLGVTGKDERRILEILRRGGLVSGASRFRWTGIEAAMGELSELLGSFPDADPARAFTAALCFQALLRGGRQPIAIPREAGERAGMFRRGNFWSELMEVAGTGLRYGGYSYRDRADRYARDLHAAEVERLREAAGLLRYSTLRDTIRTAGFTAVELLSRR
jgi:hypothetical protein